MWCSYLIGKTSNVKYEHGLVYLDFLVLSSLNIGTVMLGGVNIYEYNLLREVSMVVINYEYQYYSL